MTEKTLSEKGFPKDALFTTYFKNDVADAVRRLKEKISSNPHIDDESERHTSWIIDEIFGSELAGVKK